MKFTLTVNSHGLSDFQECEAKYLYKSIIGLTSTVNRPAMERGTIIAKWLQFYYQNKITPRTSYQRVLANPLLWTKRLIQSCKYSQQEAFHAYGACINYASEYKSETWTPIATEKGFSKILYEDGKNLFVYEGRPDLIFANGNYKGVADHKTQSMAYSIYSFNNQCRGYLWALGAHEFVYNYIKLLKNSVEYRREAHTFTQTQLDTWKSDTIEWCFRMKHAIQSTSFLKSWHCSNQYGKCPYTSICEQTRDDARSFVIRSQFKMEKPYRSW